MNFENKNISINLVKIAIILGVIQAITQCIITVFLLNSYNKFLTLHFFNLFIIFIKSLFYKKINNYLNFCNRFFKRIIIHLIEILLKGKNNNFIIKFLFKVLKI